MSDLLKNAKRRRSERDAIYERKLAKEQREEEELNPEFMGKERFMTSAYKQKLAERAAMDKEQEAQDKTDVYSNQRGNGKGVGMANFYSNLSRHGEGGASSSRQDTGEVEKSTMGRGENQATHLKDESKPAFLDGFEAAPSARPGFLDGFEAAGPKQNDKQETGHNEEHKLPPKNIVPNSRTMRQIREEKVAQARIRYLRRRGMTEEEASRERIP